MERLKFKQLTLKQLTLKQRLIPANVVTQISTTDQVASAVCKSVAEVLSHRSARCASQWRSSWAPPRR